MRLRRNDGIQAAANASGDGPVHATLRALEMATGCALVVSDFQIRSVSMGGDAQGQASVSVFHDAREYRGRGASTDIIEAAALAFLEVFNCIHRNQAAADTAPLRAINA